MLSIRLNPIILALGLATPAFSVSGELIDYPSLNHDIAITSFRSGNHDTSGENHYYMTVTMHGLLVAKEEIVKPLNERKKVTKNLGEFADITIASLSFLKDKEMPHLAISGEAMRQVTSDVMKMFSVTEEDVAILIEISLFEREKILGFFGDDRLVGSTSYFAIPETLPRSPNRKDLELTITDKLGTNVALEVSYAAENKNTAAR